MATEKNIMGLSGYAAADYNTTSYQYYGAYLSAAETWTKVATAGAFCQGTLQNAPKQYEHTSVGAIGVVKCKLGGTVSIGDPLYVDSSGTLQKNVFGNYFTVGRALEAGVLGDTIAVDMRDRGYNQTQADMTEDNCMVPARWIKACFNPSATSGSRTIAAHGLGVYLPDNAIVIRSFYVVETTFTSATDAATIAIHVQAANDIVTATAISAGGNVWDAGNHEAIQDTWAVADFTTRTSAISEVTATVASEALTAGKLYLYLQYIVVA